MKFTILELPLEQEQWPSWLEPILVSDELRDLVRQLKMVRKVSSTETLSLQAICGSTLPAVYEQGLVALSTSQWSTLLQNPNLLLELQILVLAHGGTYWRRYDQPANDSDRIHAGWQKLRPQLEKIVQSPEFLAKRDSISSLQPTLANTSPAPANTSQPAIYRRSSRRVWLSGLATLAASIVLLFSYFAWNNSKEELAFGSTKTLELKLVNSQYLKAIGDSAETWFAERPWSDAKLQKRLAQLDAGCQRLIAAPHQQLSNFDDRQWLVNRCREWQIKIQRHQSDLASKAKTSGEVLREADETVHALQRALSEKAIAIG